MLVNFKAIGLMFAAEVDYNPGSPGRLTGHPDNREPSDPATIEFNELDAVAMCSNAMFLLESDIGALIEDAAILAIEKELKNG